MGLRTLGFRCRGFGVWGWGSPCWTSGFGSLGWRKRKGRRTGCAQIFYFENSRCVFGGVGVSEVS